MDYLRGCLLVALIAVPALSAAVDGVAVEFGMGDDDTLRGGGALVVDWDVKWLPVGPVFLGGQWEFSGSYWNTDAGRTGVGELAEMGITPVFRLQTDRPLMGVMPFVEAAIGAHFMTHTEFGDRRLGINYIFGDHLGAGVRFGEAGRFELNYRFQHLSNGSISRHNDGINFQLVRFGYRF